MRTKSGLTFFILIGASGAVAVTRLQSVVSPRPAVKNPPHLKSNSAFPDLIDNILTVLSSLHTVADMMLTFFSYLYDSLLRDCLTQ